MDVPDDKLASQKWMRITLINLLIVAALGSVMRYKIAYSLPFIQQENFLHAHSHFAFTGWVSQALMTLMTAFLARYSPVNIFKKYKWLLTANLIAAYGMLFSFIWQGYGAVSIIFSTASVFVAYAFAYIFWRDVNKIDPKTVSIYYFKAALIFNVISSFGPYMLSYMMINHITHPNWFLAATYYFLHFQYNGWFFFACMGLISERLTLAGIAFSFQKRIFLMFAASCVPAYFLSALWLHIALGGYIIVIIAAIVQLLAWLILLKKIIENKASFFKGVSAQTKWIVILAAIALTIKLMLQVGSTIPLLSKLAFGLRPIVIGYIHLVLLGVITLIIIGYAKMNSTIVTKRRGNAGIFIFISGIILNELILMLQGISYMNYTAVPYINQLLLTAAIVMFSGILVFNLGVSSGRNIADKNYPGP